MPSDSSKTFGTDPAASRALLQQILGAPRFSKHAHEEAPWLAEGVPAIVPFDADFAAEIYAVLFGRPAPQEGKSWLGGQPIKNGCRVRRTTRSSTLICAPVSLIMCTGGDRIERVRLFRRSRDAAD